MGEKVPACFLVRKDFFFDVTENCSKIFFFVVMLVFYYYHSDQKTALTSDSFI